MQDRHIKANEIDLYTESFGEPSNPTILLIMGAMASAVWWPEEFCRQLAARGRHVIRYDHRDTGRSVSYEPWQINYSVEDLADDAVGVLNAYGIERAHLVGMSLGGFLAQLVALKYPDRVLTLTLIASERLGPGDPDIPPIDQKITTYHAQAGVLDWSDREAVVEWQVGGWRLLSGSERPFDEATIRALSVQDVNRTKNMLTAMNHALLSGGEEWFDRFDEIRVPALIIHGTDDPVLRYAHGVALAKSLPQATLLTLKGAGHELHRNDWETIITSVVRHTTL
jgi:pimeloyl-ACP methyl ester carboxylesterase